MYVNPYLQVWSLTASLIPDYVLLYKTSSFAQELLFTTAPDNVISMAQAHAGDAGDVLISGIAVKSWSGVHVVTWCPVNHCLQQQLVLMTMLRMMEVKRTPHSKLVLLIMHGDRRSWWLTYIIPTCMHGYWVRVSFLYKLSGFQRCCRW